MRIEDALDEARGRKVPWDEVRERRVLARVRAAIGDSRGRRPSPVRWMAVGSAALATVAVAVFLLWPTGPTPSMEEPKVATVDPPVAAPAPDPSLLQLADGSAARLSPGAEVEVTLQTATAIELRQRVGEVRYDVVHDPARSLTVDAAGVIVRVVGTVFTLDVAQDRVEVDVESGHVEVDDGERVSQVAEGHRLSVPVPGPVEDTQPEEKEPVDRTRVAPNPSVPVLLEQADAARKARDWDSAARLLRKVIALRPGKLQSSSALFTLGRVERSRRRHAEAATAFRSCRTRSPSGPLAEDALAEEATSWADAGAHDRARAAAGTYLERYPDGTHHRRMQAILAPSR
jgi:transmembrane sensor